jgi:hypothetical protein
VGPAIYEMDYVDLEDAVEDVMEAGVGCTEPIVVLMIVNMIKY